MKDKQIKKNSNDSSNDTGRGKVYRRFLEHVFVCVREKASKGKGQEIKDDREIRGHGDWISC